MQSKRITIRQGCFETNSSSTHSLVMPDGKNLKLNYDVLTQKEINDGEIIVYPEEYGSSGSADGFHEKLNYAIVYILSGLRYTLSYSNFRLPESEILEYLEKQPEWCYLRDYINRVLGVNVRVVASDDRYYPLGSLDDVGIGEPMFDPASIALGIFLFSSDARVEFSYN